MLIAATGRARLALFTCAVAFVAMHWTFVLRVLPSFERYKPAPALTAAMLREGAGPEDRIVHFNVSLPSMVFYLQRHIDMYFELGPFIDAMKSDKRLFVVLTAEGYEALKGPFKDHYGVTTCVLHRQPTINFKLKEVVTRKPLPELLLITNRCQE